METIVELIDRVIQAPDNTAELEAVAKAVNTLMAGRPLFNA